MSNKKDSSKQFGSEKWQDKLHLVEFSFEDEEQIHRWYEREKPDTWPIFSEMLDSGWSVRVSPPKQGDDYWCTATAKSVEKSLDGHSFSIRYPDMETAVILCGYVVLVMIPDNQLDQLVQPKSRAWLKT